jgi:hypothetical protein
MTKRETGPIQLIAIEGGETNLLAIHHPLQIITLLASSSGNCDTNT